MVQSGYEGLKYEANQLSKVEDNLVVEEALQININHEPYTVIMQSPGDERELVRGLLYVEDIYKNKHTPLPIDDLEQNAKGVITSVNVTINNEELGDGYLNSRSILSVSSCGICGKKELGDIQVTGKAVQYKEHLQLSRIEEMFAQMKKEQKAFHLSGGSHAAAAFTISGDLLTLREDIGRHNAVDKVIGALLNKQELPAAKCLLVSGRISYEIITKTFRAKIPFLAAVSAPSSLAVDFAKELGITLLAFCRNGKATCYSHPERLIV